MKTEKTERGFIRTEHNRYASDPPVDCRLLQESSAIDCELDDGMESPGSSYLWLGEDHHLSRDEVRDVIRRMQHWLDHKRLPLD